MLDNRTVGELPAKHHVALRDREGRLRHEECVTRAGFDGPYSLLYHEHRPHTHRPIAAPGSWALPKPGDEAPLAKRHFRSGALGERQGAMSAARLPLLFNDDVVVGVAFPDADDPTWVVGGDGDELLFVLEGGGKLLTPLGILEFGALDYVFVPKGMPHRFLVDEGPQHWLTVECAGGLELPGQWRNPIGQLRMDAPFGHRDFRRPRFVGPDDRGVRELLVKKNNRFHGFSLQHSPADVVGWEGTVYPWAFPLMAFQPRVSSVHLPPTWHGTFQTRGVLICSFVPRPVDFGEGSIPCPYPHSSVDVDEVLFYCSGDFTSRKGVGKGSVSYHPAGIPHGPHPGAYEASIGSTRTEELAVMLDCYATLQATELATGVEDRAYMSSF
jgi:homogentisate 1,2-dioxygenase